MSLIIVNGLARGKKFCTSCLGLLIDDIKYSSRSLLCEAKQSYRFTTYQDARRVKQIFYEYHPLRATSSSKITGPRSACHSAKSLLMLMNIIAWGPQVTSKKVRRVTQNLSNISLWLNEMENTDLD